MEDLGRHWCSDATMTSSEDILSELTQYGIHLPFRVAVVGQTNSGKTHSIMHRWLGGNISFWHPDNDDSMAVPTMLQHCLLCSNGRMSMSEKDTLVQHFVHNQQQQQQCLFHMGRFPTKQDIFEFIARTSSNNNDKPPPPPQKCQKKREKSSKTSETQLCNYLKRTPKILFLMKMKDPLPVG